MPGPNTTWSADTRENDVIFNYPDSQRVSIVVRSAVGPQADAEELRNAVTVLDPTLPVDVDTLGQRVAKLAERQRFSAALLSLFAVVGLLLTASGIYGVVSLLVSQRTQEIGIRMALGATPMSVIRMMVWQASIWIGFGAAAGILGSLAAAAGLAHCCLASGPTTRQRWPKPQPSSDRGAVWGMGSRSTSCQDRSHGSVAL